MHLDLQISYGKMKYYADAIHFAAILIALEHSMDCMELAPFSHGLYCLIGSGWKQTSQLLGAP